jgi:hypothetical protein
MATVGQLIVEADRVDDDIGKAAEAVFRLCCERVGGSALSSDDFRQLAEGMCANNCVLARWLWRNWRSFASDFLPDALASTVLMYPRLRRRMSGNLPVTSRRRSPARTGSGAAAQLQSPTTLATLDA